ncbi:MAG: transglycosylase SLT domain-containing protein [Anaerolineaceae bacterium]
MNRVTWAIFPGVIFGSAVVALIAMLVTSGSTYQAYLVQTAFKAAQPITIQEAPEPAPENVVEQSAAPEQPVSGTDCQVSEGYPETVRQWCGLITQYAQENNLDPNLIAALILQESGGDPTAYSHSGAVGLMQVMPRDGIAASFQCNSGPCFASRPTIQELEDPEFNVSYGTRMLAGLINKRGNTRDALMAYGPANVGYYYADIVLAIYEKY